jgi:methionyl-tRNA formyltransferase
MRIGIITYDHPHRKTQDLLCKLILSGYQDIELIVLPWTDYKKRTPFYQHRPIDVVPITTEQLCERLGLRYHRGNIVEILNQIEYDKILIAGCGVLPQEILKYNIINSHPGYLPNIRGLDALKWAILKGDPIGVTTYIIGEDVDTGRMIDRQILPLYHLDTFHSIAQRQYELEITMMVEALTKESTDIEFLSRFSVGGRMDYRDEIRMIARLTNHLSKL